eukprot:5354105-Prymnesium_polylepis.2
MLRTLLHRAVSTSCCHSATFSYADRDSTPTSRRDITWSMVRSSSSCSPYSRHASMPRSCTALSSRATSQST